MRLHVDLKRRGVGDTVNLSGLVRDLAAADPDIRISVSGNSPDAVFLYDPHYCGSDPAGAERTLHLDYKPTINRARGGDRSARYAYAAHDAYDAVVGGRVPRGLPRPRLLLGAGERERPYVEPYAVVACGVKEDLPVKQWPLASFQRVTDATADLNWKQVGLVYDGRLMHRQTALTGVDNLLSRTDLRQMFRLIAHARVVLCHVSLPMLVASAFAVPCVVVAGGREDPTLFDDLGATVLHTIGRLDCCATGGCYASAALPSRRPDEFPPRWLCVDPVPVPDERAVGRCMTLISPEDVVDRVLAAVR